MSRRNNASLRCARCRMHQSLCVCALIPTLKTRTRVLLVIHRAEDRKPTNTGRLATECLVNSEVVVRGRRETESAPLPIAEGTQPVLLYPAEDAVPLTELRFDRPVTLIVPDGNWRQASKVRNRVPGMREVPCATLPPRPLEPSVYRLRVEAHDHGLATIEAIARALGILDGDAIEQALMLPFRAMVERTLWARGDLRDHEVTGGIPDGVMRHDPSSGTFAR